MPPPNPFSDKIQTHKRSKIKLFVFGSCFRTIAVILVLVFSFSGKTCALRDFETHSLTQYIDFCSCRGDLRAEEAAVLLQAVLLAAVDRRCGKVISVQSLTLSDRLCRCLPRLRPPSMVPCMMVREKVSCLMTWPDHANFRRLTVARRGSRGPTRLVTKIQT